MATTKRRPRVGDSVWAVEWTSQIPVNEFGDSDIDRATVHVRHFDSEQEAWVYAREVYPKDVGGAVSVWPREFVAYDPADAFRYPHAGYWEDTADAEYYEGE